MRRTQPEAITFILTGYPDIETALEAIRQQVDDYLIKPTEIDSLVSAIKSKLENRTPARGLQPQRLADIIEQHQDSIVEQWLTLAKKDPEINGIEMPDADRKDHIPRLLKEAVQRARGRDVSPEEADAAALHGITRRKQGYTIPLLVREAKLLLRVIAECVQHNLLAIQVSNLIPDLMRVWDIVETELEFSMRAFLEASTDSSLSRLQSPPERRKARNRRA
jgi:CheY-like chemotaxis protein